MSLRETYDDVRRADVAALPGDGSAVRRLRRWSTASHYVVTCAAWAAIAWLVFR